jgi:hypothetical protein
MHTHKNVSCIPYSINRLFGAGLPDGIFSKQQSQFDKILEGLAMDDVGILYGYLVYFVGIFMYICLFGIFYGYLVYFMVVWYILWLFGIFFSVLVCCTKKNLATLVRSHLSK